MLGNLIGAMVGERAARQIAGANGAGGALLGAAATTLLRRLGPAGLPAAAAGGYALKRIHDQRQRSTSVP